MPPHTNLKLYNPSHGADDKSSNPVFSGLAAPFKGAATALMLGTTIALTALPANAQEAPDNSVVKTASVHTVAVNTPQPVSLSTDSVVFYSDANRKASDWVKDDPSLRVAVSIRYGGATPFKPEDIQRTLERDFSASNLGQAVFYWEHGLAENGTSVAVETRNAGIYGPYPLGKIQAEIPQIADQIEFNASRGSSPAPTLP